MGGIVHHQERHALLHIVVEDAHNRVVDERGNCLGFLLEVLGLFVSEMGVQHLDGGLLIEPKVLA